MVKKISVIGNPCSGKTTLSRRLADVTGLNLYHVDSIQFLPQMKLRDPQQTRSILQNITEKESWIVDGVGPLNILEDRLKKSDLIVVIRVPFRQNIWWICKRWLKSIFSQRAELPDDCYEASPVQTYKLIKNFLNVEKGLWPQLDRILERSDYKSKVVRLKSKAELNRFEVTPVNSK